MIEYQLNLLEKFNNNKASILLFITKNLPPNDELSGFFYKLVNLQVTSLSKFGDDIWDYNNDVLNPARNSQGAPLRINFEKYNCIPEFVKYEIKCLILNNSIDPDKFSNKTNNKTTFCEKYNLLLRYFNHIYESLSNQYGDSFIVESKCDLSQISENDFVEHTQSLKGGSAFRKIIDSLDNPHLWETLGVKKPKIDFRKLKFTIIKKKKKTYNYIPTKPFSLLVKEATFIIIRFLVLIDEEVQDKKALELSAGFPSNEPNVTQKRLNAYTYHRLFSAGYDKTFIENLIGEIPIKYSSSIHGNTKNENIHRYQPSTFHAKFDQVGKFSDYLSNIHAAALFLIGSFTGMRPQELQNLDINQSLIFKNGFEWLATNINKGKLDKFKLFDDKFLAIPIIIDAFNVCKHICKLRQTPYLFCTSITVKSDEKARAMKSHQIASALQKFINSILGQSCGIKFNTYMMRHTLAFQLYRVELGLPFISFQLKHLVTDIDRWSNFSETTLFYGDLANQLVGLEHSKIGHKVELEKVSSFYNPDGVYAGGAAEKHTSRVKSYFKGCMEAGYTKEEVLEALVEQGIAVTNVGLGYCMATNQKEDFDENLPCIGSLRCNPASCPQAVITEEFEETWKEIQVHSKSILTEPDNDDFYAGKKAQAAELLNISTSVLELLKNNDSGVTHA